MAKKVVTYGIEALPLMIRYEPDTGFLFWKERPLSLCKTEGFCDFFNRRWAGKRAFTATDSKGYFYGTILQRIYRAHRVAWLLMTGEWPVGDIDHIDGDPKNNKFSNLRDVTSSENHRNARLSKRNKSGATGVCWHKKTGKWQASVTVDYQHKTLGFFENKEEAIAARLAANTELGFSSRHGEAR